MGFKVYARHGGAAAAATDDITARVPGFTGAGEGAVPLIQLGMSCQNGGASQGTFVVPDPIGNQDASLYFPPHALITWTEDASGDELWLSRGRISAYEIGRGDSKGDDNVEWSFTVDDANVDLRGLAFTEDWVRPTETEVARLLALQAYTLNGTSSTRPTSGGVISYRPSTTITVSTSHLMPNTATVTMPAKTYPANTQPMDVVNDCNTTAGKVYGVVIHHTGGTSHLCLLLVAETDHATYASAIKISDQVADWDPNDLSTPVFAPIWDQGRGQIVDGNQNISGLVSRYGPGDSFVATLNATLGNVNEYWNDGYQDGDSVDATQATNRAAALVAYRTPYAETDRCSIIMLAEQTHLLAAGMSLQIKASPINTGNTSTIGTYLDRRVVGLNWEPRPDGTYKAILQLNRPQRGGGAGASAGQVQPASTVPRSGTTGQCIETFTRTVAAGWGRSEVVANQDWYTIGSYAAFSVEGTKGVIIRDVGNPTMLLNPGYALPVELLIKQHFERTGGAVATALGYWASSDITLTDDGAAGIPLLRLFMDYEDGTVSGLADSLRLTLNANRTGSNTNVSSGAVFDARSEHWIRVRFEQNHLYAKSWLHGGAEQGSWDIDLAITGFAASFAYFFIQALTGTSGGGDAGFVAGIRQVIDSYQVVEPCGGTGAGIITGGPLATTGTSALYAPVDHYHDSVDNGGAATGDLGGTYGAPIVEAINGVTVAGTPSAGQVITALTATTADWETPSGGTGLFVPAGSGDPKLDTGLIRIYDQNELAYLGLNGDAEIATDTDQPIYLEPNFATPGGPAKVYILGGSGLVLPILSADPSGGNSEDAQLYYNSASNTFRVYSNGVWTDIPFMQNAIGTADLAIANTETVVVSKTFAATELVAGMTFMFKAYATRSGTTSASPVIRIRIGTTTLTGNIAATVTPPANTLADPNEIEGMVTIRSAGSGGTALGSLKHTVHLAAVTITEALGVSTGTVAVNTTSANQKIELTFISGNASNTYTFRNAAIYRVV